MRDELDSTSIEISDENDVDMWKREQLEKGALGGFPEVANPFFYQFFSLGFLELIKPWVISFLYCVDSLFFWLRLRAIFNVTIILAKYIWPTYSPTLRL